VRQAGCPEPPPLRAAPQAHILHEACLAVGSVAKLAVLLGVTVAALTLWLDGTEQPPAEICRACADIILLK
jgi:DNA-binding transcriptional regulator YdaS (Cro superfamily)